MVCLEALPSEAEVSIALQKDSHISVVQVTTERELAHTVSLAT